MLKDEIELRLNELKDCEVVKFTMIEGATFDIPVENIINYPDAEMIEAPIDNFKCFYFDIASIQPIL